MRRICIIKLVVGLVFLFPIWLFMSPFSLLADTDRVVVLTEEEAIEMALANNYDLLSKEQEVEAASARLKQAWSQALPYVTVGASWTHYEDHPFMTFETNRGYNISVSQILFSGGRVANTIISAKKALKASKEDKKENENKIVYSVKQAFYTVLLAKELVEIREETLELAKESLSITQKRYKAGESAYYDVLRSEVEVSNLETQLIKARNFLETSFNLLKLLLGLDPEQKMDVKGEFSYMPEDIDLEKMIDRAMKSRPVLKQLALQEEAAGAQVRAAFAGFLPQVRFNFTDCANQKEAFSWGRDEYDDYWVATVSVSMPLFDGFLTYARVKEARAKKRQVSILKKKLRDSVKVEVENAILDLQAAKKNVEAQKENVERAEEAYRIVKERYAQGQASHLDLLDARVALSTARVNFINSLYDFVVAKAKLDYVVGGGKI